MKALLGYMLLAGVGAVLFAIWWNTQEIKRIAWLKAKQHCKELGLQMLDDSMVLRRIRFNRLWRGRPSVTRVFAFEFSSQGDERYSGEVEMVGRVMQQLDLEAHRIDVD